MVAKGVVPKEAKIARYSYEDEQRKVEAEANLLYWADLLMSLANGFRLLNVPLMAIPVL